MTNSEWYTIMVFVAVFALMAAVIWGINLYGENAARKEKDHEDALERAEQDQARDAKGDPRSTT